MELSEWLACFLAALALAFCGLALPKGIQRIRHNAHVSVVAKRTMGLFPLENHNAAD